MSPVKEQSSDDPLCLQPPCGFKAVCIQHFDKSYGMSFFSQNSLSIELFMILKLTKVRSLKIPNYAFVKSLYIVSTLFTTTSCRDKDKTSVKLVMVAIENDDIKSSFWVWLISDHTSYLNTWNFGDQLNVGIMSNNIWGPVECWHYEQ